MWPLLVQLVIAQAPPAQVDPALVEAVAKAIAALVGSGVGGLSILGVLAYLAKQWFAIQRRKNGDDPEYTAKTETRQRIEAQGDQLVKVASNLETSSKLLEQMLEEMRNMRRESFQAHATIQATLSSRGT